MAEKWKEDRDGEMSKEGEEEKNKADDVNLDIPTFPDDASLNTIISEFQEHEHINFESPLFDWKNVLPNKKQDSLGDKHFDQVYVSSLPMTQSEKDYVWKQFVKHYNENLKHDPKQEHTIVMPKGILITATEGLYEEGTKEQDSESRKRPSQDDVKTPGSKRGPYKCGLCGAYPKTGHVCMFKKVLKEEFQQKKTFFSIPNIIVNEDGCVQPQIQGFLDGEEGHHPNNKEKAGSCNHREDDEKPKEGKEEE